MDWKALKHGRICGHETLTDRVLATWADPVRGPQTRRELWEATKKALPEALDQWKKRTAPQVHTIADAFRAGAENIDALDRAVAAIPVLTPQEVSLVMETQRWLFEDIDLACERALGALSIEYITFVSAHTHQVIEAEPSEDVRTFVLRLLRRANRRFAIMDMMDAAVDMAASYPSFVEVEEDDDGPTVEEIETPYLGGERDDMDEIFDDVDKEGENDPGEPTIIGFDYPVWLTAFCNLVFVSLWHDQGETQQFATAARFVIAYREGGVHEVLHHVYRLYYTNLVRQEFEKVLNGLVPRDAHILDGYREDIARFKQTYVNTGRGFLGAQRRARREAAMLCFRRILARDKLLFRNLGDAWVEVGFMVMGLLRGMALGGLFGEWWTKMVDRANRPVGHYMGWESPDLQWVKNIPAEWYESVSPTVKQVFPAPVQKFFVQLYDAFPAGVAAKDIQVIITEKTLITGQDRALGERWSMATILAGTQTKVIQIPDMMQPVKDDVLFNITVTHYGDVLREIAPHIDTVMPRWRDQGLQGFINSVRYLVEWQTGHLRSLFVVPIMERGFLGMWQALTDRSTLFVGALAATVAVVATKQGGLHDKSFEQLLTKGKVAEAMLQTHRVVACEEFFMREILGGLFHMELLEYEGIEGAIAIPVGMNAWSVRSLKAPGNVRELLRDSIRRVLRPIDTLGYHLPWLVPAASLGLSLVSTIGSPINFHANISVESVDVVPAMSLLQRRIDAAMTPGVTAGVLVSHKKQMWLHFIGVVIHRIGIDGVAWALVKKHGPGMKERETFVVLTEPKSDPLAFLPFLTRGMKDSLYNFGEWIMATRLVGGVGGNLVKGGDLVLDLAVTGTDAAVVTLSLYNMIPWHSLAFAMTGTLSFYLAARVEGFVTGEKPKNTAVVAAGGAAVRAVAKRWWDFILEFEWEPLFSTAIFFLVLGEVGKFFLQHYSPFGQPMLLSSKKTTKK